MTTSCPQSLTFLRRSNVFANCTWKLNHQVIWFSLFFTTSSNHFFPHPQRTVTAESLYIWGKKGTSYKQQTSEIRLSSCKNKSGKIPFWILQVEVFTIRDKFHTHTADWMVVLYIRKEKLSETPFSHLWNKKFTTENISCPLGAKIGRIYTFTISTVLNWIKINEDQYSRKTNHLSIWLNR